MNSPLNAPNSVRELIDAYIDLGFAVIPLWGIKDGHCTCPAGVDCKRSQGKHPLGRLVPNGLKNATRDKVIVHEWFKRAPGCNWGVLAGQPLADGGFTLVVDVDPRNGGFDSLAEVTKLNGELPDTWTQDTGGKGNHYILKTDRPCESYTLAPGIDVLGEGKYFVVAPSLHESGSDYSWSIGKAPWDIPIAKAPLWLVGDVAGGAKRPSRDGETARETVLGEAFHLAGKLGVPFADGTYGVECPWVTEHSDDRGRGNDTSTVILPPAGGSRFGGFKCMHSHCVGRKWDDVIRKLPPAATVAANQKYPRIAAVPNDFVQDDGDEEDTTASDYQTKLDDCRKRLNYKPTKTGFKIQSDLINAVTIFTYDPRWQGILRMNEFSQEIEFARPPQWHVDDKPSVPFKTWSDEALNCTDAWFRRFWGLELSVEKILQAVSIVAKRDAYHPLKNYLDTLVWDNKPRLNTWLIDHLGVEASDFAKSAGRKWLLSAVARIYRPGCKADHVLILEGPQGRGKSTALSVIAGAAFFADTPIDIGNKDAYLALRGKWIVELAELSSLKKADIDRAKAFFSSPSDYYRPPYGRVPTDNPRQCVFAGTVNLNEYLSDETGNRRFWPVRCGIIDLEGLAEARSQIWAEAVAIYKDWAMRGSPADECLWWPSYEEKGIFEEQQALRATGDMWTTPVENWLTFKSTKEILRTIGFLSASEVLKGALDIEFADQDAAKAARLGRVMRDLGFEPFKLKGARIYRPSSSAAAR